MKLLFWFIKRLFGIDESRASRSSVNVIERVYTTEPRVCWDTEDEPTFLCYGKMTRKQEETDVIMAYNEVTVDDEEEVVEEQPMDVLYKQYLQKVEPSNIRKKALEEWRRTQESYDEIRKKFSFG